MTAEEERVGDPEGRSAETPANYKRTPPLDELQEDPLDSGRRLTSNQLFIGVIAVALLLAVVFALIYI